MAAKNNNSGLKTTHTHTHTHTHTRVFPLGFLMLFNIYRFVPATVLYEYDVL